MARNAREARGRGEPLMHHDTYMRLFWEHHEAETEKFAGMRGWLDKLERKVG